MAQKKVVKKKAKRGARKKFFEVEVPLVSSKVHLYGADASDLDGRIVKLDLTRSLKGKAFEFKLRVVADGEKLSGEPVSLILAGSYIRKSVRKGSDYVEDSFDGECKGGKAKVKFILVTRNRVSRAVRKALREGARKYLIAYLKTRTERELFSEIMANKLQRQLSSKLKKIYPLAMCEIRWFEVLREKEEDE